MSHGGMSVAQAKELQKVFGGRVIAVGSPDDRRSSWYANNDIEPTSDNIDAVSLAHIVVSRDKNHKGELVSKTLKSRKGNVGLGGFTVQRFER